MTANFCPICHLPLKESIKLGEDYADYKCVKYEGQDHFYVHRVLDDDILKIKVRIDDLYLKIEFDEGKSQVWVSTTPRHKRITINNVFIPDFSDLEKIKRKIKTLLTFS